MIGSVYAMLALLFASHALMTGVLTETIEKEGEAMASPPECYPI